MYSGRSPPTSHNISRINFSSDDDDEIYKTERKGVKTKIPKKVKEELWILHNKKKFENKCFVKWCSTVINVFNFQAGHNIPHSKGGTINLYNLRPICGNCNMGMGDKYTIDEWNNIVIDNHKTTKKYLHKLQKYINRNDFFMSFIYLIFISILITIFIIYVF